MKVCLVSPPTITECKGTPAGRIEELHSAANQPALGILSLAAVLETRGAGVEICDLDRLFRQFAADRIQTRDDSFYLYATRELLRSDAAVFGFGTLCNTYPLTVRMAREVKRVRPEATVLFGGPQASAVDLETLRAFPFVDVVVRGEAEESLPALLDALDRQASLPGVPGISFRRGGLAVRTQDAALPDISALPNPAYHLWPDMAQASSLPLEAGRGCPFDCAFCSTNRYFRRRYRLKRTDRIIEEMRFLWRIYPARRLDLIHDAFTVDRAKVVEFCRALLDAGDGFRWTCSARTDCVDDELLRLMAAAGCTDIYFGIETGSVRVQHAIHKRLDAGEALEALRAADRHSISTTISLITGFPEEKTDDLRATLSFLMDAVRIATVESQFDLVAPLAGSALYEQYRGRLQWDGIFSDMASQGWSKSPADRELIVGHPDVFPNFYALPTALDRNYLKCLRDFLIYALARFRWLVIALEQRTGGALGLFDRWRQRRPNGADREYYAGPEFRRDFLAFASAECLAAEAADQRAISVLLEYERERAAAVEPKEPSRRAGTGLDAVPCLAPGVTVVGVHDDYQSILECLKSRRSSSEVPVRPAMLAERRTFEGRIELLQLSPLSAALVRLCDGTRTVREIAAVFPTLQDGLERFPPEAACAFALNRLAQQGLLGLSATESAP